MTDAPRPRDEWRWLIAHRLGSIEAIEKYWGVDALPVLAREKRALASLDVFINEHEAELIAERNRRNRR